MTPTPAGPVCWLLPDLSHYHHARISAYVARGDRPVVVVQASDTSGFREFKHPTDRPAGYHIATLFRGVYFRDLPPARLRAAAAAVLDDLAPVAVVVQGWAEPLSLAALRWAVRRGTPRVVTSETQRDDFPRAAVKEWVKRRLVGLFGAALCGGTRHAAYLADLGMPAGRVFLGYDAVDNGHFAAGADAARGDPGRRAALGLPPSYLLASARFIPKKNLPGLLIGYADYRRRVGSGAWDLVVLGDGAGRADLEARRAALGLGGVVHLPGFRSYDDLPAYYGLAEAFVHASTVEQWGLVVNEAAAAGLPVVASARCGATADLVRDGETGYVFDPADSAALGRALAELHGRPDRAAMGGAGRRLVAGWGPERFAAGLAGAVAAATPASPAGLLSRAVLRSASVRPPDPGGE